MKRTYKNVDGKGNVTYVEYEIDDIIEINQTTYTIEQLSKMTDEELQSICNSLGISTDMDKDNMISLIINKQN